MYADLCGLSARVSERDNLRRSKEQAKRKGFSHVREVYNDAESLPCRVSLRVGHRGQVFNDADAT